MQYYNPTLFQRWERIRKQGRKEFVLRYGVVYWGLMVAAITSLFDIVIGESLVKILLNFIVIPLLGFLAGYLIWWYGEYVYREYKGRGGRAKG